MKVLTEDNFFNVKLSNQIAIITLTRTNKLNALNIELIEKLKVELEKLDQLIDVSGIILRGTDKSFIVGADINEMKNLDSVTSRKFITLLHQLIHTIRHLNKPVISAVNGYCFGAGLELAISCDLLIASSEATFGMQEVKIGIPSVIEAALLPFVIGLQNTREMLLTGEVIDCKKAKEIGLVNLIVSHERLLNQAIGFTRKITENPRHSVILQKQLINKWLENAGVNQSIKNSIDSFGLAFGYPETNERLSHTLRNDK
jgi:enoyl-CoA hydratase